MRPAQIAAVALTVGLTAGLGTLSGCDSDDQGGTSGGTRGTSGAALDGCTVVTTAMLNDDLGLGLPKAGQSTPSFYGDADVTDCSWFVDSTTVSLYATDDAGQDLPDGDIEGYLQSGGEKVPGADRGVAYATSNVDGSNVDLIVVKGKLGIELAASSPGAMTQAQALALGQHVAAALGS